MKERIFYLTFFVLFIGISACNTDDINLVTSTETERTFTVTVLMPDDKPTTRVGLEQKIDKSIELTWENGDQLELVFVQGDIKIKNTVKIKNISEDRKKADFDILLPENIKIENFSLFGTYGGGGLSDENPTHAKLPINLKEASTLFDIQNRKDVMLYFKLVDIDPSNPPTSVFFHHLGSVFSIILKNSDNTDLENLFEARLVGVNNNENKNWAYNSDAGYGYYDLISEEFQNIESAINYISFRAEKDNLTGGDSITFWGWYPPLPDKNWPELKLELRDTGASNKISLNSKQLSSESIVAGKVYYIYANWDGSNLFFINDPSNEYLVNVEIMGTLSTLLTPAQKANIEKLTIKGNINADDFEVLKNEMPKLRYLDLKDVKCENDMIPSDAFGGYMSSGSPNKLISTIILPNSIVAIGFSAFQGCTGLTGSLNLPDGLQIILDSAFDGCTGLNGTLNLPESLEEIGESAFAGCSGFTGSLSLHDGLGIGEAAFADCSGFNGTLTLPKRLGGIARLAFYGCNGFTGSLLLPNGLKNIGEGAFFGCSGFTGPLILPEGLTHIDRHAFSGCSGFTGSLTIPDGMTTIERGVFSGCSGFTGSLILPDDITVIDIAAFYGCSGFTGSLNLPSKLKMIRQMAFTNCSSFTGSLTLPEGLSEIEDEAFSGCSGFTELVLGNNVVSIYNKAFSDCSNISGKVIFPISLQYIASEAFFGCDKVNAFRFPHAAPLGHSSEMLPNGATIEVPLSTVATYKVTDGWKDYKIVGYLPLSVDLPVIK